MKVYIVHGVSGYEDTGIVGVFTTREKADACEEESKVALEWQDGPRVWGQKYDYTTTTVEEVR